MDTHPDAISRRQSQLDAWAAFRVFNPVTGVILCLEGLFHVIGGGAPVLIWFPLVSGIGLLALSYQQRDLDRLNTPWWLLLPQTLVLVELSIHYAHGSGFAEILMMVGFSFTCAALITSIPLASISLLLNAAVLAAFLALSPDLVWQNSAFIWFLCQVATVATNYWRRHKVKADAQLQREQLAIISGELAHELNNHLMGVSGGLEMAASGVKDPKAREGLEIATHGVRRIAAVGKHLASVAGESPPPRETFQLDRHLTAETLRSYLPGDVILHFDCARNLPEVRGNLYQLVSALGELVRYAGESACRQKSRWVGVKLSDTAAAVTVEVHYPGDEAEPLKSLFAAESEPRLKTGFDFGVQFAAGVIQRNAEDIRIGTDASGCTVLALRLQSSADIPKSVATGSDPLGV
ncbi:MAG: hypothetical protein AAGA23_16820 [Pseudomonadota bacterium]